MNDRDSVIHITREEATSREVDDFLKRQMSLRGDSGVTRNEARHWMYQSWFIFMIVGALGAFVAWAIQEPFFDDTLYTQGPIEAVDAAFIPDPQDKDHVLPQLTARLRVNGESLIVFSGTRELPKGQASRPLDLATLKRGTAAGFHLEDHALPQPDGTQAFMVRFVVPDPGPAPAGGVPSLHVQAARQSAWGLLIFPLTAGMIGLFLGATDGIICRLPRRALLCGIVGLLVGVVGGLVTSVVANIVYAPISTYAMKQGGDGAGAQAMSFGIQMLGRTIAWGLAGTAMGLGQGVALRSSRLLAYGFIGGIVGGLLGGLFFDPVDAMLAGADRVSGYLSRLVGFTVIGACVGCMTGVVELLARDAWLRMSQGPLKGKEFLIFKDVMRVGSSPRSDLYLFNDSRVHEQHAVIRAVGDECEIEATHPATHPVLVNSRAVSRSRLKHGDDVTVGATIFVFQKRKS
jgi:hypothetical protein